MRFISTIGFISLSVLLGCSSNKTDGSIKRFELLSSEITGVHFQNSINSNDSINIMNFEYLYNGGGVGVLDVNNDGLKDLFFTGSQQNNALYLNLGDLKFKDISQQAGIEMPNTWSTGVSVVDINADGLDDLYIGVGGMGNKSNHPNKLFINQGDNTFKEMAEEYGLADMGETIQSVFFDYDKDGDLDVYLLTGGGFEKSAIIARPINTQGQSRNTDRLYRNEANDSLGHPVFKNVSAESGIQIEGFGLGVAILDANQDSWPDVYVSNDYLSRDLLYVNNQDGTFSDKGSEYLKHTSHFSMGNDVGDINNDGLADIVTVDMLPEDNERRKLMSGAGGYDLFYIAVDRGYTYQYMRNMLQVNHGDKGFSEIGQMAGIDKTDWSWAPLLADFDNDGFQDLYITNGFGKDITDMDFVKFRQDAVQKYSDKSKFNSILADSLKVRPAISLQNYMYRNNQNLSFTNEVNDWGLGYNSVSSGAVYVDLDGDGDLEIVVSNIDNEAFIFKNRTNELDSLNANYLRVKLNGPAENAKGLGAEIELKQSTGVQKRWHQVVRGFQSSVEEIGHFGLGNLQSIEELKVTWPDGKVSRLSSVSANQIVEVNYAEAKRETESPTESKTLFTKAELIEFTHIENDFSDFKTQPLLLHGFSQQGPSITVADVDNDGLDDVFVGGAYGQSGAIFIQNKQSQFQKKEINSEYFEDLGAIFFDADNDNDLDLYVTSGGSERYEGHNAYQDRLYFNDGKGNFELNEAALPVMTSSTSAVTAADFDMDGDLDLFVGGRVKPRDYPNIPTSYLLINEGGKFTDETDGRAVGLRNIGMVTSAVWSDLNGDDFPDLVLAGESMPVSIYQNEAGQLKNITATAGLAQSHGMWNSLKTADFDNDGDLDIIAGNIGLNTPFKASVDQPFELHFSDFDHNGAVDPIFSSFENGKAVPFTSLDQLTKQLPVLKKKIFHYRDYAKATTEQLLQIAGGVEYSTLKCETLATSFIENLGNGQFKVSELPIEIQVAPAYGLFTEDINSDGLLDIVAVGSNYDTEVMYGRYDASIGTVLINKGDNQFEALPFTQTGFSVRGDAKAITRLELANGGSAMLITQTNGPLISYTYANSHSQKIRANSSEVKAKLKLKNGQQRLVEFTWGGAYLSQDSRTIVANQVISSIEFYDTHGKPTRQLELE